jgi:hypothetical protein
MTCGSRVVSLVNFFSPQSSWWGTGPVVLKYTDVEKEAKLRTLYPYLHCKDPSGFAFRSQANSWLSLEKYRMWFFSYWKTFMVLYSCTPDLSLSNDTGALICVRTTSVAPNCCDGKPGLPNSLVRGVLLQSPSKTTSLLIPLSSLPHSWLFPDEEQGLINALH